MNHNPARSTANRGGESGNITPRPVQCGSTNTA